QRGGLIIDDAYHGMTSITNDISPLVETLPEHIKGLTPPDGYRHGDNSEALLAQAQQAIDTLKQQGDGLSSWMIDSALCSSGVPEVSNRYFQNMADLVRQNGGLIIADEVQSGFGRLGKMWGCEARGFDHEADIVTLGKPVANGHPLGVVITRREYLNRFINRTELFSTFGGNPVSCAGGLAVLDEIQQQDLIAHGQRVGDYFRDQLSRLAAKVSRETSHPNILIGDVRGRGLLIGLEFVTDLDTKAPATEAVQRLVEMLKERYILVGREGKGKNIFKMRPNFMLQNCHVDQFVAALADALKQLNG
ncbi:aminotransferase class III-fold pyridoxal phosphate-dependent enzyme, partial [Vibrio sp.]|uniref:aminotransferase class III-fold pyridoxal phosphate-dependent enzyme n=1 Tax=Vibrio sp. TaxID=678 RepID=UPI003D1068D9